MRTITFDSDFSPEELAKALVGAGFNGATTLNEIVARSVEYLDEVDENVTLDIIVSEDDVVEALGDKAIVAAFRDCVDVDTNECAIEDGISYVRRGDLGMARAMFSRVFEGVEYDAVERALA